MNRGLTVAVTFPGPQAFHVQKLLSLLKRRSCTLATVPHVAGRVMAPRTPSSYPQKLWVWELVWQRDRADVSVVGPTGEVLSWVIQGGPMESPGSS